MIFHRQTTNNVNKAESKKKKVHSLTVRLSIVFAIASVVIIILLVQAFQFAARERTQSHWKEILVNYVELVSQNIEAPFTATQASILAGKVRTQVSMQNTSGLWVPFPPPFDLADLHLRNSPSASIKLSRNRGYFIIVQNHKSGRIVYYARPIEGLNFLSTGTLLMLSLVLLVIFLCFHYAKSLLRPIQAINSAAEKLYQGNFNTVVPVMRDDELGQLAQTFNSMSTKIKQMLDAKHQLLVALSHEIRSPLTRIRMASELLTEAESRTDIISDVRLMEQIIVEIMEGERLSEGQSSLNIKTFTVSRLLESVLDELNQTERAQLSLTGNNEVRLAADPLRLKIVIRNLISNALRYSLGAVRENQSTPIAAAKEREPSIQIAWNVENNQATIAVKDQGPGFTEGDLASVGKPFFKADRARPHASGFGMGLYLGKLIVEAHGGRLEIKSETGKGAEIVIWIPQNRTTAV